MQPGGDVSPDGLNGPVIHNDCLYENENKSYFGMIITKNGFLSTSIGTYVIGVFLFFMLLFPSQYQSVRGIFLSVIIFCSILLVIKKPTVWHISKEILAVSLACLLMSVLSLSYGVYLNNPGAIPAFTVYLIWPILFIWIVGFSSNQESMYLMIKVIIMASFVIALSILLFVLSTVLGFGGTGFLEIFNIRMGLFHGAIKVSSQMTPVLLFFLPFSICLLLIRKQLSSGQFSNFWRKLLILTILLTVMNLLITGRSVFWLIALISLPLVFFVVYACGMRVSIFKFMPYSLLAIIVIAGISYFVSGTLLELDLGVYFDLFMDKIFNVSDPSSAGYRRYEQFVHLREGIYSAPIFGKGFGAVEYGGSDVWQFELSYVGLLFQVGILGMSTYVASIIWLVATLVKVSRKDKSIAVLVAPILSGMLGFLVANATNPLLSKFDFLWVIFLPLALANYALYKKDYIKSLKNTVLA